MARLPSATESEIQAAIIEYLNYQPGVRVWRRNVGAMAGSHNGRKWFVRFGAKGMADIEGIGPGGRHIEIEVKRAGKKPTQEQLDWLEDCRVCGAIAFWADSLESAIEQWIMSSA